jgi:hypothetical protein
MKTPITDAAIKEYIANGQPDRTIGRPMARLELDRAALMDALAEIHQNSEMGSFAENKAWDALSAARANFPEP